MTKPMPHPVLTLNAEEAKQLMDQAGVRILDVRSPAEYQHLGHLPGALLLPVEWIFSAPAILPREGRPLLVLCQHGIRSAHAAQVLAQAGFSPIYDLAGGLSSWPGELEHTPVAPGTLLGPSSWLTACVPHLRAGGATLDLACGTGRHALPLAAAGFAVLALDSNQTKLDELQRMSRRLNLPVETRHCDLEQPGFSLGQAAFDLIVGIHYLHRPLFPALIQSLRPGGLLLYETFLKAQAARGGPHNPDYLLAPGELKSLVAPLRIVQHREGLFEDRAVAAVLAVNSPERKGPAPAS